MKKGKGPRTAQILRSPKSQPKSKRKTEEKTSVPDKSEGKRWERARKVQRMAAGIAKVTITPRSVL